MLASGTLARTTVALPRISWVLIWPRRLLMSPMTLPTKSPGDFVGSVIGDLNSRRGQIRSQEMRGNATVIRANVPLANMFGYVSQLRSMSQGRAMYTMQFAHYAEVPRNVADEVKAKYA